MSTEVVERRIKEPLIPRAEYRLQESVSGIGRTPAPVILLDTGPIGRFAGAGNYAYYARCGGSRHSSNGRKRVKGNTRTEGVSSLQVAWPYALPSPYYKLVTCPVLPMLQVSESSDGDTTGGLGYTLLNDFIAPMKSDSFVRATGHAWNVLEPDYQFETQIGCEQVSEVFTLAPGSQPNGNSNNRQLPFGLREQSRSG
jgi:hypothetical protein